MKKLNSPFKIESCENVYQLLILAVLFSLPFYFIKFKFSWLSLNLVEILVIILCLAWALNKKFKIQNSKYKLPVIFIFTGLFLSIIAGDNYYAGLGVIKGWFMFPIVFSAILQDSLKKDSKLLDKIFAALFASGSLVSIIGIYYKLSGFLAYDGRLKIFYDSPNQLAMFLSPIFLVGFFLIEQNMVNRKKRLLIAGQILILINLYLTKSYGAWLSISGVLAVVFWLKYKSALNKKYLLFCLVILTAFFSWAGIDKYKQIEKLGERSSLASRTMIWKSAGLMIKNSPLFGIGPGNFQNKYLEYQKYFPPYLEWSVPQPHNLFLAFWLEAGLVGLLGFILLLIQFFKDNKKAIVNNRSYGILCLAIVLYFLFHGLVDTTYWRNDMAVVFWAIISINLLLASGKDEEFEKKSNL
jgi:O-antigen ligase